MCKFHTVRPICPTCLRIRPESDEHDPLIVDPHPITICDQALQRQRICRESEEDRTQPDHINVLSSVQCHFCIDNDALDLLANISFAERVDSGLLNLDADVTLQKRFLPAGRPEQTDGDQGPLISLLTNALRLKADRIADGYRFTIPSRSVAQLGRPHPRNMGARQYLQYIYDQPMVRGRPQTPLSAVCARMRTWCYSDRLGTAIHELSQKLLVGTWSHMALTDVPKPILAAVCLFAACHQSYEHRTLPEIGALTHIHPAAIQDVLARACKFVSHRAFLDIKSVDHEYYPQVQPLPSYSSDTDYDDVTSLVNFANVSVNDDSGAEDDDISVEYMPSSPIYWASSPSKSVSPTPFMILRSDSPVYAPVSPIPEDISPAIYRRGEKRPIIFSLSPEEEGQERPMKKRKVWPDSAANTAHVHTLRSGRGRGKK